MKSLRTLTVVALACLLASTRSQAGDIEGHVVTQAGEPIEHAIVFLKGGSVPEPPGDHTPAIMDQVDKEFVPHVLPIVVGTPVRFPNHDQIHHHVYSFSHLMSFDLPLYRDEEPPPVPFEHPGVVRVGCNIHDWMSGIIVVLPTEYFATTDASGAFAIKDVPPGSHVVLAWHERGAQKVEETAQPVQLGSGPVSLRFVLPLQEAHERARQDGAREFR